MAEEAEDVDSLVSSLSEDEKNMLKNSLGSTDTKHNVHSFLNNVAVAQDTTKLGNLDIVELGKAENPLRAYKFLALFADKIMNKPELKEYLIAHGENLTATSLSKDAILLKLAVTQKKELADITPRKIMTENKGWFKKKEPTEGETQS